MKIKKMSRYTLIVFAFLFLLTGCGTKEKSKKEIIEDLQKHPGFYSAQILSIDELSIDKRQTNDDEKTDYVYVTVAASNENIKCDLNYELRYILYNEGWVLEEVIPINEENWRIDPLVIPDNEFVEELISQTYDSCSVISGPVIESFNSVTFECVTKKNSPYVTLVEDKTFKFDFDGEKAEWKHSVLKRNDFTFIWDVAGEWKPDPSRYNNEIDNDVVDKIRVIIEDVPGQNYVKHVTMKYDGEICVDKDFEFSDNYQYNYYYDGYTVVPSRIMVLYIYSDKIYVKMDSKEYYLVR